jgi:hypothetical protein
MGDTRGDTDWATLYARMDERLRLKYQQLPKGEQVGRGPDLQKAAEKPSEPRRPLGFGANK